VNRRCIPGISAKKERLKETVETSIGLATALNPYIGYKAATTIALEAQATGKGVRQLVIAKNLLLAEQIEEVLQPEALANTTIPRQQK
jgi:aspartate ammonia-lyase